MKVSRRSVVAGLAVSPFASIGFVRSARANDLVRVACPQKGAWDTMIVPQGDLSGIFKKVGIDVDTYNAPIAQMSDRVVTMMDGKIATESRNTKRKPPGDVSW